MSQLSGAGAEIRYSSSADLLQGGGGGITLPKQPYRHVCGITYYDMQWAKPPLRGGGLGAVGAAACWAEEEVPRGMVVDLINKMWHNIFCRQWLLSRRRPVLVAVATAAAAASAAVSSA